ncbi:MAG: MFS transporter [Dehalococcoidia bacterium]
MADQVPHPEIAQLDLRVEKRAGALRALAHRDYRLLLAGTVGSQLAMWSQQLGMGWLVYELTGSPFQLGLVFFFNGIAMLLLAPVGGTLADRFDRRGVMAISQTAMVAGVLLLAMLVVTDVVRIWHIYILSFVISAFFALNTPSRQAIVHDLVGPADLTSAVSLNAVSMNSMRVVGPAVGGVLLATVGVEGTFFLQAGGFLWAMLLVLLIRRRHVPASSNQAPFLASIRDGFQYARRDRNIATLLVVAVVFSILGMSYMQLMPAYAGDVLGLEGGGFGLIMALSGVGALLGAVAVTVLGDFTGKGRAILGSVLVTGVLIVGLGAFGSFAAAVPVLAGLGLASAVTMALSQVLLHTAVEDQYRGRVMALYFLTFGLQPLGGLPAGAIAEVIGIQPMFAIMGVLVIVITGWITVTSPHLRRL